MADFDYNEGEKEKKEAEKKRRREREELRELLSTKVGRKFIFKQLVEGYIFTSTFTGNSATFKNEGKREMALETFTAILDVEPDSFTKMYQEFRHEFNL